MRRLALPVFAALSLALVLPAAAADTPQRREAGQVVFDGVPDIPQALRERLAEYQNARSAGLIDWLDDGSMLIRTRFGETNQVHRVKAPGADRTQLTFFSEPVGEATAVPGNPDMFLYARDVGGAEYYQAWIRDLAGHETLITAPKTRNQSFVFSKDGALLAWAQVTPGDPNYDIVVMDPNDPASRSVVHEGKGAISPIAVSPDGKSLLLGRYNSALSSERFLLDIASGRLTPVRPTPAPAALEGGEFTPDGRSVILLSDENAEVLRPVRIDLATGALTDLVPGARWPTEALDISPDGRTLAYAINEEGASRVFLLDLKSGKSTPLPDQPLGVLAGFHFSPDGRKLGFGVSGATSAGDVYAWDLKRKRLDRWTFSELGGLDPERLVEPTLIHYPTFDGRQIPAHVYRPKGATGRLPVVIQIHGGPESQERPSFNARRQSWVGELGAVVITPNVRGSDGYGKTWLALDNAEKREDSVKDIGALLDWIAAQPDLDASRVAVVGQSYGGYMVLATLGRYDSRLAGAIDLYGISNWTTFLQNTEGYRRDNRRAEYGDERDPAMRAVFDRISPMNFTKDMTKPMMVFQGANDPRVPRSESEQMVARLRGQGNEVWYVLAKDEGHGLSKKSNNDVVRAVELMFLKRVLRIP
jgi:dipeptidyl aminopeptidase/acylaminoacyl peptidase